MFFKPLKLGVMLSMHMFSFRIPMEDLKHFKIIIYTKFHDIFGVIHELERR